MTFPLYRSGEFRKIEALASDLPLMQRAGESAAALAETLVQNADPRRAILVLAGPGNNGGDAFVAARLLRERAFDVTLVFTGRRDKLPDDAAEAARRFADSGGLCLSAIPETPGYSLIIDGLFGIGLKREIGGEYADYINRANWLSRENACPLLALDCPSGLDADTGMIRNAAVMATHTISFIAHKPGLFTADGPDHCGHISLATLNLAAEQWVTPPGFLVGVEHFSSVLRPRLRNTHKGCYGSVGVLGGADGMSGAALLAARAALYLGAGRVYLGTLGSQALTLDPMQPELMCRTPEALLALLPGAPTVLVCGPGLGSGPRAENLIAKACQIDAPLVLDADALNDLSDNAGLRQQLAQRAFPAILTPHPAEAARLLAVTAAAIQSDRIAAAVELAGRYHAYVALKGCGTLVADPEGAWFVNPTGNPGLATAGSGDVLAGIVAAFLAQGHPPLSALLCAVHLHGAAADRLALQGKGPVGLTAGELIGSARAVFNAWIGDCSRRTIGPETIAAL